MSPTIRIGFLTFLVMAIGVARPAFARAVGRCTDQVRWQTFEFMADGWVVQVGNPANAGRSFPDPSGRMFLMLPSTTPQWNAFFVSWSGDLVEHSHFNGVNIIGSCSFEPGILPSSPPWVQIWQPPPLHPSMGVSTPQGLMPIPAAIADSSQPFAAPMLASEATAQQCYQQAWTTQGLNRDEFGNCMLRAMTGKRELAAFDCVRQSNSPEDQAFCMVGALGGKREKQIASALQNCYATYQTDYSRYPLCLSGIEIGGELGKALACVEQQSQQGQVTVMGTAMCYGAKQLKLNPETQIFMQCAVGTSGDPIAFAGCAGGQLTARELDKCLQHGVGGPNGCFGPNNTVVQGLNNIGQTLAQQFGPTNDLVQAWNVAYHDITQGPGPNNTAVKTFRDVSNAVASAPENVVREVKKVMPRIKF